MLGRQNSPAASRIKDANLPTLNWIGKEAVVRHHEDVPYRLVEPVPSLSCGPADSGNLIVQGDNLQPLKALLPRYAGQVKCIYIDPPYNTGNEGWVYNDNVNSPEIRKWLGEVVGKEGETLDRHDRWLCMMYPRLVLLKRFLREDGVILISIDDFEAHNLRLLVDEIFGAHNFIAQLVWDKTRKNDARLFSASHEYILVFANSLRKLKELKTLWREQKPGAREVVAQWRSLQKKHGVDYDTIQNELRDWYKQFPKGSAAKKLSRARWVDQYGPWRDRDISWPGGNGPRYDVPHPTTGLPCKVPEAGWRFATVEEMKRQIALGLVVFRDDHSEPPIRKAHLLPPEWEIESPPNSGAETDEGDDQIEQGKEDDEAGLLVMPSLIQKQAQVSVKLLRQIFGGRATFQNPKDHEVIARLIRYVTGPNDLVLDSFGGSGTTGHSVLELNVDAESNCNFILVEIDPSIARDVTAERLKRVANGYTKTTGEAVPGLGGGFQFCHLSAKPIFTAQGQIRSDVTFAQLAEFVWFAETGSGYAGKSDSPMLGTYDGRAIYLLYNGILKDRSAAGGNILTGAVYGSLPKFEGPKVIYAAACRLGDARLSRDDIVFKQTPYALDV